jgi:hypothetical protein
MTVRVRDILKEIEALSAEERKELEASLRETDSSIQYIPQDEALEAAERIFNERAELFKKLAE